jgi:hypothetical protein
VLVCWWCVDLLMRWCVAVLISELLCMGELGVVRLPEMSKCRTVWCKLSESLLGWVV